MTEQVAIKHIEDHFDIHNDGRPHPFLDEAVSMAIKALKELELYKQGGLRLVPADIYKKQCEKLDELKEKQIAKKPIFSGLYACPCCKTLLLYGTFEAKGDCCKHCGQRLDWEEG